MDLPRDYDYLPLPHKHRLSISGWRAAVESVLLPLPRKHRVSTSAAFEQAFAPYLPLPHKHRVSTSLPCEGDQPAYLPLPHNHRVSTSEFLQRDDAKPNSRFSPSKKLTIAARNQLATAE